MNISGIKLLTPGDDEVVHANFPIRNLSASDPYIIKSSTGFDADEIFPKNAGYFVDFFSEGAITEFYDMMLGDRTVSLLVKPNPDYRANQTVGHLRDTLYKAIAYTRYTNLELRLMEIVDDLGTEEDIASLFGRIAKIESDLFSNDPNVTITFECSDPFLRSNDYISIDGSEFVDASEPLWNDDDSTAPHGYTFRMDFSDDKDGLTVYPVNGGTFSIDYEFEAGDHLYLSSEYNNRYLYVVKGFDDSTVHLTDKVVAGSVWPMMLPGENEVKFHAPFESFTEGVIVTLTYRTSYWGG